MRYFENIAIPVQCNWSKLISEIFNYASKIKNMMATVIESENLRLFQQN